MRADFVKRLLVAAALVLAGSTVVAAQAVGPKLVIAATIVGQQYCGNNPVMATLQMRVRLRYINTGNQKLILYRGEDLFYQAKIRAAAATEGARPYEIAVLNARYLKVEDEPVEQPAPGKLFVTLQPGASYETETMVGIGVAAPNVARDRHAILEGEHTLQLVVSTWYRSQALAEKLRREWQRKGFLWSSTIDTSPITFRAERPPSLSPCR